MTAFFFVLNIAFAAPIKNIPQIGPHERVLTLTKSENPQNVLAIYTKIKSNCTLAYNGKWPELGYYWLMGGSAYKRVHPLILAGIRSRFKIQPGGDAHSFTVEFGDLKDLDTDFKKNAIKLSVSHHNGSCMAEADLRLGPSDHEAVMRLTDIHSETKKTFLPPFRKVVSVTLDGFDLKTGREIHRTYSAKH